MAKPELSSEFKKLAQFYDAFQGESDRGAALSAAAMLEDKLGEILTTFLVDGDQTKELLNGFNAPLGTLSARITAASTMGLIGSDEYKEMQLVRRIRNKFAHNWQGMTFEDQAVIDLCNNLPWRGPAEHEEKADTRGRFVAAVALLLLDLVWRGRIVIKEKREQRTWPSRARK